MITDRARAIALLATSLGFGVVQLDVSVVNVAIAPIRADLGGSVGGIQWVVNAYTVVFASLILSAGALGDRVGAKRVFVTGFALFSVASAACGLAPTLAALVAFRAVQGVGAALLVPSSLSVLNHAYPEPSERARAVGLWAAGASLGLSGGPLVGGVLTSALSWRWIFFINVPLGVLGVLLTVRYAQETTRSTDRPLDLAGQLLGVATLASLAAAMIEGGQRGFGDPLVLTGFAVAVVAGVAFVAVEHRRRAPMLPLSLFRSPAFRASSAIGLVVNIAFYGLIFVLSLYFQTALHYSPLRTGLAFAPSTGIVLISNIAAGRVTGRFGIRWVVTVAAAAMAAALAGLLGSDSSTPYSHVVLQLTVLGAALGLIVPAITTALLGSVDRTRSGIAAGTLNTARQSGSVIGVALFGSLAAHDVVTGLHRSLIVAVALALATALLAQTFGRSRHDAAAVSESA